MNYPRMQKHAKAKDLLQKLNEIENRTDDANNKYNQ